MSEYRPSTSKSTVTSAKYTKYNKYLLIFFVFLNTLLFLSLYSLNKPQRTPITVHYNDLNGDDFDEKITFSYETTESRLTTVLEIQEKNSLFWITAYTDVIEHIGPPVPSYQGALTGKIVGFIKVNGKNVLVVQTARKGSGGFVGYKVYALKNGKYSVIHGENQLNHGLIKIEKQKLIVQTDYPQPQDPNCCSSRLKIKEIIFDKELNPQFTQTIILKND